MTRFGVQDGDELEVDLRPFPIETWDDLWDALTELCELPSMFGRNLNAWWDTIEAGAISDRIDDHPSMVVLLNAIGLFTPGNEDGEAFIAVTNDCSYARVIVGSERNG